MTGPSTALSVEAITRASARLSLLFCGTALVGLPFALRAGWQPRVVVLLVALLSCLVIAFRTFVRNGGRRWAAALLACVCVTNALVSSAVDLLRPDALHMIVSWINAGVGGALALSLGARWGLAALVLGMTTAYGAEYLAGGTVAPDNLAGPVTYVLGSALARGAAIRGDAATERALAAKEAAEADLRVAEERWTASRAVQRELHDTVLATLTMLAHRGEGVSAEAVVGACARDADRLRWGILDQVGRVEPVGGSVNGRGGVVPGALGREALGREALGRGGARGRSAPEGLELRDEIAAGVSPVHGGGFDVRVHAAGRAYESARVAAPVAVALRDALGESLRNARQHAGVQAADVTVIVDDGQVSVIVLDEGCGFDPVAVPGDRLGLRDSVAGRLADVGGKATIWSGPGLGTSVLLVVPALPDGAGHGTERATDQASQEADQAAGRVAS